jgi:hypothetical protein
MDFDPLIAAQWCQAHNISLLSPDQHRSLQNFADITLRAIHNDPDLPSPEVRLYSHSIKFILRTAARQEKCSRA